MKQVLINNKKVNFITSNELEKYRVETLFEKEAETIEWIKRWNKEITESKNMTFFDVQYLASPHTCFQCNNDDSLQFTRHR